MAPWVRAAAFVVLACASGCGIAPRSTVQGDEGLLVLSVAAPHSEDASLYVLPTVDRRDLRGLEAPGTQRWSLPVGVHTLEVQVWAEVTDLVGSWESQSCEGERFDVCTPFSQYVQELQPGEVWRCEQRVRLKVAARGRYVVSVAAGPGRCELRCDPSVSPDCEPASF